MKVSFHVLVMPYRNFRQIISPFAHLLEGGNLPCFRCSDSGERCEVKKEMKSRGGTGESGAVRVYCSLSHLSPSLVFIFSHSLLLRTGCFPLSERQEQASGNFAVDEINDSSGWISKEQRKNDLD